MIITASQKYVRCGEQKLRFVADSVKKLDLKTMRDQLKFMNKEPARRLLQTLDQAIANANHNFGVGIDDLSLDTLLILRGPQYKRMRAVSRGQGHAILKRTAHIVIKLKSAEGKKVEAPKAEVVQEEVKKTAVKKVAAKKPAVKKTTAKKAVTTKEEEK